MRVKGVVVGCDRAQEWMLKWWWSNYIKHNQYPVAFVDFGMTPQAKAWCKTKGYWVNLEMRHHFVFPKPLISPELVSEWEKSCGEALWSSRETKFCKPLALTQAPFDLGVWVDLDCEITGSLSPVFDKIHPQSKMALVKELGGYNSGVVAYDRSSPLISLWRDLCLHENDRFFSERDVLTFIVNSEPVEIVELPSKYNWVIRDGINIEAVVLHWAGLWGKEVIRRKCG